MAGSRGAVLPRLGGNTQGGWEKFRNFCCNFAPPAHSHEVVARDLWFAGWCCSGKIWTVAMHCQRLPDIVAVARAGKVLARHDVWPIQ